MPLAGRLAEVACATIQAEGDGGGCRWKSCINDGTSPTTSSVPLAFRRPLPGVHHAYPSFFLLGLAAVVLIASATTARAGGTVELTLVGEGQGSALYFQEWSQALGRAGIRNVRIRARTPKATSRASSPKAMPTGPSTSSSASSLPATKSYCPAPDSDAATWLGSPRVGERLGRQRAGCRPRGSPVYPPLFRPTPASLRSCASQRPRARHP